MKSPLPVFLLLLISVAAAAQTLTLGGLYLQQTGRLIPGDGLVVIDASHPATADGTITHASVASSAIAYCVEGFRIRIVRPADDGTYATVGETAPLPVIGRTGVQHVSFAPIAVKKGDLLGIVQGGENCGAAIFTYSPTPGDTVIVGKTVFRGMRLEAIASHGPQHLVGVVPVVGSVQGAGAFFRTSLQLTNPTYDTIEGLLILHPDGATLPFILGPMGSATYDDVAASFGRSGIGSLDVFTSSVTPEVTARVFNDGGAAGTYGLSEELVRPEEMLNSTVAEAAIPIPRDLTNFRVNVGVRTLDAPVQVGVVVFDAKGVNLGPAPSRSYDPNHFEQVPLESFIGRTPPEGGSLLIVVSGGSAVFYTSTIDNRTNDSALKMIVAR